MCHLLPASAVGMLGHLLGSEPVKFARALSPGQAVVTKHHSAHTFIASLVIFTSG